MVQRRLAGHEHTKDKEADDRGGEEGVHGLGLALGVVLDVLHHLGEGHTHHGEQQADEDDDGKEQWRGRWPPPAGCTRWRR